MLFYDKDIPCLEQLDLPCSFMKIQNCLLESIFDWLSNVKVRCFSLWDHSSITLSGDYYKYNHYNVIVYYLSTIQIQHGFYSFVCKSSIHWLWYCQRKHAAFSCYYWLSRITLGSHSHEFILSCERRVFNSALSKTTIHSYRKELF